MRTLLKLFAWVSVCNSKSVHTNMCIWWYVLCMYMLLFMWPVCMSLMFGWVCMHVYMFFCVHAHLSVHRKFSDLVSVRMFICMYISLVYVYIFICMYAVYEYSTEVMFVCVYICLLVCIRVDTITDMHVFLKQKLGGKFTNCMVSPRQFKWDIYVLMYDLCMYVCLYEYMHVYTNCMVSPRQFKWDIYVLMYDLCIYAYALVRDSQMNTMCAHVHVYIYIYIYEYVYCHFNIIWRCRTETKHTHTHTHIYIHTCMHTYIHTYIHSYIHTYIYTYIHIYIHTCMHTYILSV
jgi:hypothetical protein